MTLDQASGQSPDRQTVSFRAVALPAEHGSWSLVLEPILLGLLVAPSAAGVFAAVGGFAFFLFNRPFSLWWSDRRRGRRYTRTRKARQWAFIYLVIGLFGFGLAAVLGEIRQFLPLLMALPFGLVFVWYDQRPGRHWQAEIAAPVAFSAIVSIIGLAGGLPMGPALALWGFMIARSVPAVLFIRARLRLDKGKPVEAWGVYCAHLAAILGVGLLVWWRLLPGAAFPATLILLARAAWGLSAFRWRSSVKQLGFLETGFGLLVVSLVAAGYRLA